MLRYAKHVKDCFVEPVIRFLSLFSYDCGYDGKHEGVGGVCDSEVAGSIPGPEG